MNRTVLIHTFAAVPLSALLLVAQAQTAGTKLPPPFHSPNASNGAKVVDRPQGVQLKAPDGFTVEEFATGLKKPRLMTITPDGSILVADSVPQGSVVLLPSKQNGGERRDLITGLDRPYGMAWWKDYPYVAEPTSLNRYKYDRKGNTVGAGEEIVSLPGFDKGHWTRAITFDPSGKKMYLQVGSGSNASPDTDERRATILECNPDGKACRIFAAGLRNATEIGFHPVSKQLWASVQERDGLGDDLVPDFFTSIKEGGFYGWPWAYFGSNEDPRNAGQRPELVAKTIVPDVSLGAHTAVIGWDFYTGKQFPERYRNGAFLALRGSSNRAKRVGYSVVFVPFDKNGRPAGPPEDFVTGWMLSPDQREVWGRPTGVLQMPDGSLLVSEDGRNTIWRISYNGKATKAGS